jgi:hypothetical protein
MPNPPRSKRVQPNPFNKRVRKRFKKERIGWNHSMVNDPHFNPRPLFNRSKSKKVVEIYDPLGISRTTLKNKLIARERLATISGPIHQPLGELLLRVNRMAKKVELDQKKLLPSLNRENKFQETQKSALVKAFLKEKDIAEAVELCAEEINTHLSGFQLAVSETELAQAREKVKRHQKFIQQRFKLTLEDVRILIEGKI